MLIIAFGAVLIGCKNDNSKVDKSSESFMPNIFYKEDTIRTQFLEKGMSAKPEIDWNGKVGKISLISKIKGVSINSSTGQITWDNDLIKGNQDLKVIAKNTIGSDTVNLNIDHSLKGVFTGNYQWDGKSYFYEMEFQPEGTMRVSSDSPRSTNTGFGTWEIDSLDRLVVNYKYPTGEKSSTLGKIILVNDKIAYKGIWFDELGVLPENRGETFELLLSQNNPR